MGKEQSIFTRFGRRLSKDSLVFKEGDKGKAMFLIKKGKIKIYKTFDSDKGGHKIEKELAILSDGDFFGEMSLLNNEVRSASAIAIEDSQVLEINNHIFEQLVKSNGSFALKIIVKLSERIRNTSNIIRDVFIHRKQPQIISAISSIMVNNPAISFEELFLKLEEVDSSIFTITKEELKQLIDLLVKLGALRISDKMIIAIDNSMLSNILTLVN